MEKKLRWYETEPVIIFLTIILTLPALVLLSIGHILLIFYMPIERKIYKSSNFYLMYFDPYKPLITHSHDFKVRNNLAKMNINLDSSTSENKYKLIKDNNFIVCQKISEVSIKDNEYYVRYNFISNYIKLSDYYEEIKASCKLDNKFNCYIILKAKNIDKNLIGTNINNVYFIKEENRYTTIKTILGKKEEGK